MLFVDMGADDIGVVALGKPLGKLTAQAVCFLRGDLARREGLPDMVGDHIIFAPDPSGGGDIPVSYTHLDVYKRQLQ